MQEFPLPGSTGIMVNSVDFFQRFTAAAGPRLQTDRPAVAAGPSPTDIDRVTRLEDLFRFALCQGKPGGNYGNKDLPRQGHRGRP